jgi:hypothetical protein
MNKRRLPFHLNFTYLIIVFLLLLVAYLYGRSRTIELGDKQQSTTNISVTNVKPTKAIEPTNNLTNSGTSIHTNTETRIAIVIPPGKTVYWVTEGVDAVKTAVNQLQQKLDVGPNALHEQDQCNKRCRERMNEIISSCNYSTKAENEACLSKCPNDCAATAQKQIQEAKDSIPSITNSINKLVDKYCVW